MDMSKTEINNILVFELNWLGDILFSMPLLKAIKKAVPNVKITCAVVPRYKDLLLNNPYVDDLILLSDKRGIFHIFEKIKATSLLKKRQYDACVLLKPSVTKAKMAKIAGIKRRIGFEGKNDEINFVIKKPEESLHRIDEMLLLAKAFDIEPEDKRYEYFIDKQLRDRARSYLSGILPIQNGVIAINPGGNWGPKRWPEEKFIELAGKILKLLSDIEIIITGAEKDIDMAARIESRVNSSRCRSIAGDTDLNLLAAIFEQCELVISADSGPLHLASAVGTNTLSLFGPTSPELTGPRGKGINEVIWHEVGCSVPCYKICDNENKCMEEISSDEVCKRIFSILTVENE